jgi:hypothetical protein
MLKDLMTASQIARQNLNIAWTPAQNLIKLGMHIVPHEVI